MKHFDVRSTLIEQTIKVVANEGFDKTTTKAIVGDTGINEAYIYKFFKDKDDLLTATFSALDEELCSKTLYYVSVMNMPDIDFEMRCQFFFTAIWQFLLGNRDKCITYVRYYNSPYFRKYSSDEHKQRYVPLVNKCSAAFRDGANTWMILHHILETMLGFAIKIFNEELENNEDTAKHVFILVYGTVCSYRAEGHAC